MLSLPPAVGPVAAWRLLTGQDIDAISGLVDASRHAEGRADDISGIAELAHATFGRPGVDAGSVIGGVDDAGALLAWGTVWCRPGAPAMGRAVLSGDVHPRARRQGIGGVLLAWQESRARDRFSAELPAHLPRRVDVYADEDAHDRHALARQARLEPLRWFVAMDRTAASAIEHAALPAGVVSAAWRDDLEEAVREAHNDAFRDHFGYEPVPSDFWRHRFADDPDFLPQPSRLGLVDGSVVGYVLCQRQETAAGAPTTAWLDMIGVRRAWRGRGIASALISEAMTALLAAGYVRLRLEVDADSPTGAPRLYERHGFRATRREVLYGRELANV